MTPAPASSSPRSGRRRFWHLLCGTLFAAVFLGAAACGTGPQEAAAGDKKAAAKGDEAPPDAPALEGGVAWLNTASPLNLKDLRGRVVLLDFWTLCCINCIHVLPDLAKLEAKYPGVLVVIGVHTPKFPNEKNTESI